MPLFPSGSILMNRFEVEISPLERTDLKGGMGIVYIVYDVKKSSVVYSFGIKILNQFFYGSQTVKRCMGFD